MLTKDEVLKKLKEGETVHGFPWWFKMNENGSIYGGCDDADCCEWNFKNFEELWNRFKAHGEMWNESRPLDRIFNQDKESKWFYAGNKRRKIFL